MYVVYFIHVLVYIFLRDIFAELLGISGLYTGGLVTFLPKYLESQFSLTSSSAGIYIGILPETPVAVRIYHRFAENRR